MHGKPETHLSRLIRWRDRYVRRTNGLTGHKIPYGAPLEQWLAWRRWVDARRGDYKAAIEAARRKEKRFNQRSKDERKRNHKQSDWRPANRADGSGA
jgi:hypothetical protein